MDLYLGKCYLNLVTQNKTNDFSWLYNEESERLMKEIDMICNQNYTWRGPGWTTLDGVHLLKINKI